MSAALLPCPFCGEAPAILPRNPAIEGDAWASISCLNRKCTVRPSSVGEGDDHSDSVADAAARWNVRAPRTLPAADTIELPARSVTPLSGMLMLDLEPSDTQQVPSFTEIAR